MLFGSRFWDTMQAADGEVWLISSPHAYVQGETNSSFNSACFPLRLFNSLTPEVLSFTSHQLLTWRVDEQVLSYVDPETLRTELRATFAPGVAQRFQEVHTAGWPSNTLCWLCWRIIFSNAQWYIDFFFLKKENAEVTLLKWKYT